MTRISSISQFTRALVGALDITLGGTRNFEVKMRHPIRGLLIGPLVAPIAYWIGVMVYGWLNDFRFDWHKSLFELVVSVAFGLPIAYAVTLIWGAPILYALHRIGWLRATTLILAGALGGVLVAVLIAFDQQGALFQVRMPLSGGTVLGALVAVACWWAGRGNVTPAI